MSFHFMTDIENNMIKEIQGLRAIAILFVIFVHLPVLLPPEYFVYWDTLNRSFVTITGVELFFVIAGYFLIYSLDKIYTFNIESLVDFILKKFKRLAPAAYFWVTIALLFSLFTNNVDLWLTPNLMLEKFISTIIWLRNFNEAYSQTHLGYFWALSLEFQLFIVFAIVYYFIGRKYSIYLSVFLCFFMMFYRFGESDVAWLFRFDSMLYGVLVYILLKNINLEFIKERFGSTKLVISIVSIILILCLAASERTFGAYPNFKSSVASFVSAIMLILALSNNGYFYCDVLGINKITDWLASRSYSIYCCHIISWCIVKQIVSFLGFSLSAYTVIIGIIFMFIASEFTYRYVERLFINKNRV